jgi:hypothetical protein
VKFHSSGIPVLDIHWSGIPVGMEWSGVEVVLIQYSSGIPALVPSPLLIGSRHLPSLAEASDWLNSVTPARWKSRLLGVSPLPTPSTLNPCYGQC